PAYTPTLLRTRPLHDALPISTRTSRRCSPPTGPGDGAPDGPRDRHPRLTQQLPPGRTLADGRRAAVLDEGLIGGPPASVSLSPAQPAVPARQQGSVGTDRCSRTGWCA